MSCPPHENPNPGCRAEMQPECSRVLSIQYSSLLLLRSSDGVWMLVRSHAPHDLPLLRTSDGVWTFVRSHDLAEGRVMGGSTHPPPYFRVFGKFNN